MSTPLAIACTPQHVPVEQRPQWVSLAKEVYAAVEEVAELADGYALRLPSDAATLVRTAQYMSLDRLCCQFLRFELSAEPGVGPLWLRLTGPEGAKEAVRAGLETTDLLDERVAAAAGWQVSGRRSVESVVETLG
jgi:hypothetical protein